MYSLEILKKTIKYPTSLIIGGVDAVGIELAKALLDQGGFVILIDNLDRDFLQAIEELTTYDLFAYYDYLEVVKFEDFLRRLDYVFYLSHNINNLESEISSQDFLEFSKFLDQILNLSVKYNAKFLASTSVTAHQNLIESKVHAIELGDSDRIHTVYTQAEIQRYTESLSLEYFNKSQLNARIVRLGSVIGTDSYLSDSSKLGKILNDALFEDEIVIAGDGLDSDYYIDLKDAVYGIIKAQFSRDTAGEIYSIAYENEISLLSIVYKLNELLDYPKEIVFSEAQSNYKSYRLYKPAPNLMRIGWSPRINFERALKQTLDEFRERKEYEMNNENEIDLEQSEEVIAAPKKSGGLGAFFRWIFFSNQESSGNEDEREPEGALAHLIEERKKSSETRKGSILLANRKKDRQSVLQARPKTTRLKGTLLRKFDKFMEPFDNLRYITLKQLIFISILGCILILLYFSVFVSLVDGIKLITLINQADSNTLEKLQQPKNYTLQYSQEYGNIHKASKEMLEDVKKFNFLGNFSKYNAVYAQSEIASQAMDKIYFGIRDLDYSLGPTKDYLSAYNEKIVYKQFNQSIISVENSDLIIKEYTDYSSSYLVSQDGIQNLEKGINELSNIDTSSINQNLKTFMESFVANTNKVKDMYKKLTEIDKFLPALVGAQGEKTFVIILVDNSIYMPAGGYPVSELFITYKNGKLTNLKLYNTDTSGKLTNPDTLIVDKLNAMTQVKINSNEMGMGDIFKIDQGNVYFPLLTEYYKQKEKIQKIDGVIIINLNLLADLLDIQEPVEVENKTFTKATLLEGINQLTQENANDVEFRKELISNIFALSVQNILNNLSTNIFDLYGIIERNLNEKNITYDFENTVFDSYLKVDTRNDDNMSSVTDYLSISALSNTDGNTLAQRPLEVNVEIDTVISENGDVRKTVEIDEKNEPSVPLLIVCLPAAVSNFEFLESTQLATDLKISSYETCLQLRSSETGTYKFSFNSPALSDFDNNWDYTFAIRKQPGTIMTLNYDLLSEYGVVEQYEGVNTRDKNRAGFDGVLGNDLISRFKFQ